MIEIENDVLLNIKTKMYLLSRKKKDNVNSFRLLLVSLSLVLQYCVKGKKKPGNDYNMMYYCSTNIRVYIECS